MKAFSKFLKELNIWQLFVFSFSCCSMLIILFELLQILFSFVVSVNWLSWLLENPISLFYIGFFILLLIIRFISYEFE